MTFGRQFTKMVAIGLMSVAVVFVCDARPNGLEFDPDARASAAARAYLAPAGVTSVRLFQPDGMAREFERDPQNPDRFVDTFGWEGMDMPNGETVVTTGMDVTNGVANLVFVEGHLRRFERGGRKWEFPKAAMPLRGGSVRNLWPRPTSRRQAQRDHDIWRDTGRLRLWFVNPNRAGLFFAELGLLALGLLAFRRRWAIVTGLAGAAACFFLIVRTGSRGGVLAFLFGVLVLAVVRARPFVARAGKRAWLVAGLAVLAGVFIFCTGAPRVTQQLVSTSDGANRLRLRVLEVSPRMMVDAPGGWGWYAGGMATGAGKAFVDWYQPMQTLQLMLTLVSDHLTQLVNRGWAGRFCYLFAWMALLLLLAAGVWRGVSPLPLALWTAFLVATALNRVIESATLWIVPVAATVAFLPALWRVRSVRLYGVAGLAALALSVTALGGFWFAGTRPPGKRHLPIRAEQKRVLVNCAAKPERWLVDDGAVLGGGLAANEIRYFYRNNPMAPGLGYVRSVFDLPDDVHKLALAGEAGWEFLMGLNDGKFPATFNVPEEILFLSPPFPPQAIPDLLLQNAKVRLVIGEFAAAYFAEYRRPPEWVTVVPGSELYLPNWMFFVMAWDMDRR